MLVRSSINYEPCKPPTTITVGGPLELNLTLKPNTNGLVNVCDLGLHFRVGFDLDLTLNLIIMDLVMVCSLDGPFPHSG